MSNYRARAADFGGFLDYNTGKVKYLFATRGQLCTHTLIKERLNNSAYAKYHANIRKYGYQNVGTVVADCCGYYEMFLSGGSWQKPLTKWKYPDFATWSLLEEVEKQGLPSGPMLTLPRNCHYPLAVSYPGHVGFFYKGKVYQSASHEMGTIITDLNSTKHNKEWQYWYVIPWLDYEGWVPGQIEQEEEEMKNPYPEPTKTYPAGQTFRGPEAQWFIWELVKRGHSLIASSDIAGPNTWAAIYKEQEKSGVPIGDANEMTRMALKGESGVSLVLSLQAENKHLKEKIAAAQAALDN